MCNIYFKTFVSGGAALYEMDKKYSFESKPFKLNKYIVFS